MLSNLFCKHKDKIETDRYYKKGVNYQYPNVSSEYWFEAHKVSKCNKCNKTIDEIVLSRCYILREDLYYRIDEVKKFGYIPYEDYKCK